MLGLLFSFPVDSQTVHHHYGQSIMLDIGWQEFMMVAIVLVIVVGPKDMPRILRSVTRTVRKIRSMASDFQHSMMEVANQDELKEVRKAITDAKSGSFDDDSNPVKEIRDTVLDVQKSSGIDESLNSVKETARELDKAARSDAGEHVETGSLGIGNTAAAKSGSVKTEGSEPS